MVSFAAVAANETMDQNIKASPDTASTAAPVKAEPILRWHGRHKRKFYDLPTENPPRIFARATFATNHPSAGIVAICTETRGSYMPVGRTYFLDAGGVNVNTNYWKRGRKGWNPLKPGETGQWADITPALNYRYRNILMAAARDVTGHKILSAAQGPAFTIEFSRDGTNVIGSLSNGGGPVACGLVSLARGTVESDVELSEADLARARAAGTTPPKRPKHFAIRLCHALRTDTMTPQAYTNEVETLRLLGPNDLGLSIGEIIDPDHEFEPDYLFRNPPGSHLFNRHLGCICSPDYVGITNQLKQLLETQAGPLSRGKKLIVGTADEPHYDIRSLTNCQSRVKTCRKRHGRDFVFDPADLDGYLDTIEYRDKMVCDFYKAVTDAARSIHTNILCAANIGISLVFGGNAVEPGTDPFRMADCRALAIGQTEDWCNVQRTRQFSSYMCDVYRAAYGRNGMDIEMCSIILSAPETGAKAFAEVGHGARALSFFCYGPHWLNGDNRNQNPAIYPVLRHFCEATAEAEDAILGAKVAKGDVALFFSESCDRLQIAEGWKRDWLNRTPYGKDRMCTHLMLSHCGVRADILSEDDVAAHLAEYGALFATDRNLRRDAADAIADWMRKGGVLVRTQGALVADDRDKPLPEGFFEKAGKIIEIDFSPWRKYVWPAKQGDNCYSHRLFNETLRKKVADAVNEAGVSRRIFTDNPLVEASLLENGAKSTIVLSNWTTNAHPRVSVTLADPPQFKTMRSASGASVDRHCEGNSLTADVEIGWGDYIVIE